MRWYSDKEKASYYKGMWRGVVSTVVVAASWDIIQMITSMMSK